VLQRTARDALSFGGHKQRDAAARELRRLGARPALVARGTGGDLGALSGREREIAELVAAGRSNKQVAAALFLSEKTVENNLSRIFAKLGVRSRVELAALRVREG
ncbi:MAG TPA: helix-turn-helix transcriptional regulator, partial [Solirubrobacteraceae bacterium]|jgi:DNA-binding NarL/FixJ family response regulator